MSEDQLLIISLTIFISALVGFLGAWLLRDKENARLRREAFQARTIATSACHELRQAYGAQITTIDRMVEQNHQTMIALRQISQWIESFNPSVARVPSAPPVLCNKAPQWEIVD